jgi:branched-chain amino acid transport system substrate-binding protein
MKTSVLKAFAVSASLLSAILVSSAQAQISNDVVKIGVLNDMSGPYADITGASSLLAVQMAVEDHGGTVLGKRIEVVSADHQNKPDLGSAIARKWYDQEGVDAIIGVGSSSVALAIRSYARDKGKLDIYTTTGTSDLTGVACSPTGFHWMHDTYSLAKTIATAGVQSEGSSWYLLVADYAFGHILERDVSRFVKEAGGQMKGSVRHPVNTADFSSFLLQAQTSGAKVIGLANAGADLINTVKTAREFGIVGGGSPQKFATLLLQITDVKSLGLDLAQDLLLTEAFYWDLTDESRAWSKRFLERRKLMPNQMNAGDYGSARHFLKAVEAAGTDEPTAVAAAMRKLPINDPSIKDGKIRSDGRVERDMYLFRVKKPSTSKSEWDLYDLVSTVPFKDAFRPLSEGGCPMRAAN